MAAFKQLQGSLDAYLAAAADNNIAAYLCLVQKHVLSDFSLLYARDRQNERSGAGGKQNIVSVEVTYVRFGHGCVELYFNVVHTLKLNLEKFGNML